VYDGSKIIPGLIVFVALTLSPILLGAAGGVATRPDLTLPANEKSCVESTDYMRTSHMQMLIAWRDQVVRDGRRTYVASNGKQYEISLTGTCIQQCHNKKSEFCDRCHDYAGEKLNCWDCHLVPEEQKG
jgi:hypothetical protein